MYLFIYYYLCRHKITSAKKKPKQFLDFGKKIIQASSLFHPRAHSESCDFVLCFTRKHFWLRLNSLDCVDLTGILSRGVCVKHEVLHLSVPCKITFVIFNIGLVSYVLLLYNFK